MTNGNGSEPVGLTYPCQIDIKVFIRAEQRLVEVVTTLVREQMPASDLIGIRSRSSRGGAYFAVTCSVMASSQEQMDRLFRILSKHPDIIMVI